MGRRGAFFGILGALLVARAASVCAHHLLLTPSGARVAEHPLSVIPATLAGEVGTLALLGVLAGLLSWISARAGLALLALGGFLRPVPVPARPRARALDRRAPERPLVRRLQPPGPPAAPQGCRPRGYARPSRSRSSSSSRRPSRSSPSRGDGGRSAWTGDASHSSPRSRSRGSRPSRSSPRRRWPSGARGRRSWASSRNSIASFGDRPSPREVRLGLEELHRFLNRPSGWFADAGYPVWHSVAFGGGLVRAVSRAAAFGEAGRPPRGARVGARLGDRFPPALGGSARPGAPSPLEERGVSFPVCIATGYPSIEGRGGILLGIAGHPSGILLYNARRVPGALDRRDPRARGLRARARGGDEPGVREDGGLVRALVRRRALRPCGHDGRGPRETDDRAPRGRPRQSRSS